MKLIITNSISETEHQSLQSVFPLKIIQTAAKQALQGLGHKIKSTNKLPNTYLRKVYVTSSGGAGRILYLITVKSDKAVLLMIKMKKDKSIGSNMTIHNPKFRKKLDNNIQRVLKDLKEGAYKEYLL